MIPLAGIDMRERRSMILPNFHERRRQARAIAAAYDFFLIIISPAGWPVVFSGSTVIGSRVARRSLISLDDVEPAAARDARECRHELTRRHFSFPGCAR